MELGKTAELFMRFMATLSFGLVGIGLVMTVLLDKLFNEWDAVAAGVQAYKTWHKERQLRHERTEDILMAVEHGKTRELSTRMIDRRREELNEIGEVEQRLHQPAPAPAAESPLKVLLAVDKADSIYSTDGWEAN